MDVEQWQQQVQAARAQKDVFFATHPESPLPAEARRQFSGLAYWPPDPGFRFELTLYEHTDKSVQEVQDTGGQNRKLVRWGEFRFEVSAEPCTLQAYKGDPGEDRLFLPFRDQTSGKESYGAGRYLDLDSARDLLESGLWIIDFNNAYNPWCAYSNAYVCPFVPPENRLRVAIRAGEKVLPHAADGSTDRAFKDHGR